MRGTVAKRLRKAARKETKTPQAFKQRYKLLKRWYSQMKHPIK